MDAQSTSRRSVAALMTVVALALVTGCGGDDADDAGDRAASGDAAWSSASVDSEVPSELVVPADETDPTIPKVEVGFVQLPFNDHSYGEIGIQKGWFDEWGISIVPEPHGSVIAVDQVGPQLVADQVQIGSMASSIWALALDQTTEYKMITFADLFLAHAFLGNPDGNFKSLKEIMDGGASFEDGMKEAVAQFKGKTVAYPSETSAKLFRDYVFEVGGITPKDVKVLVLDDLKISELAASGDLDIAAPTGGPQILELQNNGWKPVVTEKEAIELGGNTDLAAATAPSGWATSGKWLEDPENHATALRMAAMMFRIIDYKAAEPLEAAKIQVPFLNSIAGTSFTPEDGIKLDRDIDPFIAFEDQQETFFSPDSGSAWYYEELLGNMIKGGVEDGLLKEEHDPDVYILADDIYRELVDLKDKSEALISEVEAASPTGKAAEQLEQAQTYFDTRNYLDAFRFANAAKQNAG